jgi:signal transduction histidine kinase
MVALPSEVSEQLAEHYRSIAKLVGGLAHEIKNPLSTISLNMELLAEDLAEPQSPRDRRALAKVGLVQRECQRLQNLLDDFLSFTRVRTPKLLPADLNRQVAQSVEFFSAEAKEANIEIVCYFDPELPTVLLESESFHRALLNLLLNARQAMPDGGQLVVRTTPCGSGVALYLIDSGCGMDAETKAKVFDTFFSTKAGGSGLGLPTARKIIEAHGGHIRIESEAHRGTKFTIELPLPPRLTATPSSPSTPPV